MDRNRALNLLSLARKGGNIQLGEENVGAASRAGQARLIVVASDAADNTYGRVKTFSHAGKTVTPAAAPCAPWPPSPMWRWPERLSTPWVSRRSTPSCWPTWTAGWSGSSSGGGRKRPIATISNTGKSNSEVAI